MPRNRYSDEDILKLHQFAVLLLTQGLRATVPQESGLHVVQELAFPIVCRGQCESSLDASQDVVEFLLREPHGKAVSAELPKAKRVLSDLASMPTAEPFCKTLAEGLSARERLHHRASVRVLRVPLALAHIDRRTDSRKAEPFQESWQWRSGSRGADR